MIGRSTMQTAAMLGLCLLSLPLAYFVRTQPQEPPHPTTAPVPPRRPLHSRSKEALRAAWWLWMQAHQAANGELEAIEEAEPAPFTAASREQCRRALIARDRSGDLHRARATAERALVLAQTPTETYEATVLRALLECELGHHRAELKHVRTLMMLAQRNPVSLMYLRRAALCNGLEPLAQWATRRLKAVTAVPHRQALG
jgi:hypothetical protein